MENINTDNCEFKKASYFKPCLGCEETSNCHYKKWQKEKQRSEKYKDTLFSIREYFEHRCDLCRDEFELLDCSVCWKRDILNKINEVLK